MQPKIVQATALEATAYRRWMRLVDAAIGARVGLIAADLPDTCYRDYFDDGLEPDEVADQALEDAGYSVYSDGPDASDGADSEF